MQFCQNHWDRLRAALDERGLSALVGKDGLAAVQATRDQLEGTPDPATAPDPLLLANWMIMHRALSVAGLWLMGAEPCTVCATPEGHCPLCELEYSAGDGSAHNWINGCTDDILQEYRVKGWMAQAH